jgi:outer membrane cobalamin receptor
MSALYGSDALGGVVNIITKAPNEESLNAQVDSYYESVGKANVNLHSSYGVNSNFFTVDLGRNFSDGWNPDGITTIRATQRNPRETYFSKNPL